MMNHLGIGHAVDIASGTKRKHTLSTHARTCPRVSRCSRNMSRVGVSTNGKTGSENGAVFPDCVDYQRVNNYFSVLTFRFVLNMDGVFKHTAEF